MIILHGGKAQIGMCLVYGYVTLINPYDNRLISLENSGRKWRKLKSLSHHAMAKALH